MIIIIINNDNNNNNNNFKYKGKIVVLPFNLLKHYFLSITPRKYLTNFHEVYSQIYSLSHSNSLKETQKLYFQIHLTLSNISSSNPLLQKNTP